MNDDSLHLTRDHVLVRSTATSKDDLFRQLVELLHGSSAALDPENVLFRLHQREQQAPTLVGHGVALPHALVPGLQRELLAVATLAEPLAYGTTPDQTVRVVFLLLGPGDRPGTHIKTLSKVARHCSDPVFLSNVFEAQDTDQLWAALRTLSV
jgi:PTS system nitrogen regulatory IIA component